MTRKTAFPNIWLESIEVAKPPFDEAGVVQEFVGRGATKEIRPIQNAADFSPDNIGKFLESAEGMIGPLRDEFKLKYNILVRAPVDNDFTKRGTSIRARTFGRVKNPFEPDVIEVSDPRVNSRMSSDKTGVVYDVSVTVTK